MLARLTDARDSFLSNNIEDTGLDGGGAAFSGVCRNSSTITGAGSSPSSATGSVRSSDAKGRCS